MESWGSFGSGGQAFLFSDEPDGSSSSMGGELGLSEILCSNNGGLVSPNSSESVSRDSNNSLESSLITLKLGRAMAATKKARTRGCYSQTAAFCQVLDCNLDLSESKDYHRKHKVCDVHSKTPKVVVNGVEQRFCQQCSRFHLLTEFDDGKRSCRRRLAGHNERRRKPQFDGLSEKKPKFSRSFHQGSVSSPSARYPGNLLQKRTPFVFSDILPAAFMSSERLDHFDYIKFEDHPVFNTNQFAPPFPEARHLQPRWAEIQQYNSEIPRGETEDNFAYSASNSPCALSLLSVQSQSFSSRQNEAPAANGPPMPRPGLYSCGTSSAAADQLEPMGLCPASHAGVDVHFVADSALRGSGSTVNLLQLSSHLQRVEHQRSFTQVKQENDDFCCFQTA